jgi:uncharacterized protein
MRIWIDLANSPHVPFFRALTPELRARGHEIEFTARNFAETVALANEAGLAADVIGRHGGRGLLVKADNLMGRALQLRRWARARKFDLAVSHNSYSQILAARMMGLRSVTLMDYEHQPANHLAFRLASRVIVPHAFPEEALARFGASAKRVSRYNGTKEDAYLAGFKPDPHFHEKLGALGIDPSDVLVLVRPPASEALYHRFENELFESLLDKLVSQPALTVILLPRNESQRELYSARRQIVIPAAPLDGGNLIFASDLVISAGGTMNREAAALGVPAATIYAGEWGAIDEELVREGKLQRLSTQADVDALKPAKKRDLRPSSASEVRREIVELILESSKLTSS